MTTSATTTAIAMAEEEAIDLELQIAEMRSRLVYTEARVVDMLSFEVARKFPRKMVVAITGSGGLWGGVGGVDRRMERAQV